MRVISYKLHVISMLLILGVLLPAKVSAHVLKTDGSVGAVLHVSPEDDPIAGESTDFFFELKDKKNLFKPEDCECRGIIVADGQEIYSVPLFQNVNPTLENASFSYTLPSKNIYKVKIIGKPTTANSFESFELEWDVRVSRGSGVEGDNPTDLKSSGKNNWYKTHFVHLILIVPASLFMIFFILKSRKSK